MVQVWRLTSLFDDVVNYKLIYTGDSETVMDFIKMYIIKIETTYTYYDRIYIVNCEEEIDNTDTYIDVILYKTELKKEDRCLDKFCCTVL